VVVVGADTVVTVDKSIYGKPKDEADAVRILSVLSGRSHIVYTGNKIANTNSWAIFKNIQFLL
jgi:septum formation protein